MSGEHQIIMRKLLQLASALALTITATSRAQVSDPNNLIAPPPPPIQFRGKHLVKPVTDLQWLWQYTAPAPGNEGGLLIDPHFHEMLHNNLTAPQSFYRDGNLPLYDVAEAYFGTHTNAVRSQDNRYIAFAGCVPHLCEDQGLLWIDTAVQHPTVVFAATEWTTEGAPVEDPNAAFNLWLFSSRPLDADHPPTALIAAIQQWNPQQHIKTALVIDPDGTPHQVNPATLGATPAPTK